MLWHSFGTMAALLQEINQIYPSINPPVLTAHQSNRVCNALALLQCVASHPDTRCWFKSHLPFQWWANLINKFYILVIGQRFCSHTSHCTCTRFCIQCPKPGEYSQCCHFVTAKKVLNFFTLLSRPFEYLRLTSLGVIGALVKTDEQEVINFLLTTEIIPLCLRIMETGSELSKTVATFILQKILIDDSGLYYICQTYDRFSHVAMILVRRDFNLDTWIGVNCQLIVNFMFQGKMVIALAKEPSARLLKHVVRCYLRLSDNQRYNFILTFTESKMSILFLSCLVQGLWSVVSVSSRPVERRHICRLFERWQVDKALVGSTS